MSDNQNKQTNECKCLGDKKVKALEKQIAELKSETAQLRKELSTIRKVLKR